jgi:signal transduction histidine kinase
VTQALAETSLVPLIGLLADQRGRAAAAEEVAGHFGARSLLILVWDQEVGFARPAPGFPQTLPGGPAWRALLARCAEPGEFEQEVVCATDGCTELAQVFVTEERTAVLLIGGEPRIRPREFAAASPLLLALLQSESRELASAALARSATDAHRHASAMALALEGARRTAADSAAALREALAHSARLNAELRALNDTLEERVREEIAERMKAEDALRQAQKMEAIGQLTGGVAHDFNNLLTVIIGGLDAIGRHLAASSEALDPARLRRNRDMALQAAQRAATLTARLLAFSRRQPLDPQPVEPDRLVRGMTDMLRSTLGETVVLETVSTPGLWTAQADPSELEHALLNLAVNARDAMPDGGKLTIETGNVFLDEEYLKSVAEPVQPGQYVMVAVSDTGHGMDPKTLEHVFEPFFTTKEPGRGTGLGLSQVYGFIRQSGGHVRIYSEVGEGTSVKLYFPRQHVDSENVQPVTQRQEKELPCGDETILVVEDDEGVRQYSTSVLRELGYRVFEAHNGPAALELLAAGSPVDLLFTDVVLPDGMHGRHLAEQARRMRPTLRVLFTSGYTRNAIVHNGRLEPGLSLLTKPFSYEQLAAKVRGVLDRIDRG